MKENKNILIIVAAVVSISLLIFLAFGVPVIKKGNAIKRADTFIAMGKYDDGIAIYDNILGNKYSEEIMAKRNAAIELAELEENLKKGLEAFEDDDINKAVKYLSKVPKSDEKRYNKAREILQDIENTMLAEVEELIENDDLNQATKMVNEYLKISPKSKKMQNVKDSIDAKLTSAKKQLEMEEQERKKQEQDLKNKETEAVIASKNAEVAQRKMDETKNIANNLQGSYKSIIAKEANLRNAPTLKSKIITVIPRGTNVYIYNTQIESVDRIWCQVMVDVNGYPEEGWISYNTMNYNIQ